MKQSLPPVRADRVLADAIAASLRAAILGGSFEPAEKLDQESMARELGVSRTPVREAIRILGSEGFLEVRPHHGAFITTLSCRDIEDIYAVRRLLEPAVFREVTSAIPENVLDQIERRLLHTRSEVERGDRSDHFATDTYFEETILSYCRNSVLKDVLQGLKNRFGLARHFALRQSGPHLLASLQEHLEILASIRARRPDEVAAVVALHLEKSAERIKMLTRPVQRSEAVSQANVESQPAVEELAATPAA